VKARIHDAIGPRWTRAVVPALAVLIAGIDLVGMPHELGPAVFVAIALGALAPVLVGRHAPRNAELELGDGVVHVRHAGILTQSIRAKTITGASSTASDDGVSLALGLRGHADHPILLELAGERDADAIRDALGVGHFGTGLLSFHASRRHADVVTLRIRMILAVTALAAAALRVAEPETAAPVAFFMLVLTFAVWLMLKNLAKNRVSGRIALDRYGVHYAHDTWVESIPFGEIESVEVAAEGLLVTRAGTRTLLAVDHARHRREGLSAAELAHVVLQIRAASRRAHGDAKPAPDAAGTTELARRGLGAREWLARLDASAKMLGASAQYRGGGFTAADLWSVLENPDAETDQRAAAARVLVASDPAARMRIDRTLTKIREPHVETRIRVMLGADVDAVSRAFDYGDERERSDGRDERDDPRTTRL
jgi:hypothetical protein